MSSGSREHCPGQGLPLRAQSSSALPARPGRHNYEDPGGHAGQAFAAAKLPSFLAVSQQTEMVDRCKIRMSNGQRDAVIMLLCLNEPGRALLGVTKLAMTTRRSSHRANQDTLSKQESQ